MIDESYSPVIFSAVASDDAASLLVTVVASMVGVGVGLGMVPTTLPIAVVLIDPAEFSPTGSALPLHAASTIRLAPTHTIRRIESLPPPIAPP